MLSPVSQEPLRGVAPHHASLEPLLERYCDSLAQIHEIIMALIGTTSLMIPKISDHLFGAGGKRIRALLLLASADLTAHLTNNPMPTERVLALAGAVELIHAATLLHDDVVDHSKMRRGQPTANQIWDNKLPILVGDYLFSRAFSLMVQSHSLPILENLSETSAQLAEGEVLQLQYERNPDLSSEVYLQIITAKTASLFSAACSSGTMLSGGDAELVTDLRELGHYFGLAFQLVDDIMDYSVGSNDMGKICGDDLREGKITLPFILLRQAVNEQQKTWLNQMIAEQANEQDLQKIQNLLQQHQIIPQARMQVLQMADQVHKILDKLQKIGKKQISENHIQNIIESLQAALQFSVGRIS